MTLPKYSLDYQACSTAELRKFICARRKTVQPTTHRRKDSNIRTLRRLAKEAKFRFFDLPGELRNLIYVELLTREDGKDSLCHPQILASCRQVHDEARHILYTANQLSVSIDIWYGWLSAFGYLWKEPTVRIENFLCGVQTQTPNMVEPLSVKWPPFLHRFERIAVYVDMHLDPVYTFETRMLKKANVSLDALASHLVPSRRLKQLSVYFEYHKPLGSTPTDPPQADDSAHLIWPILKLRPSLGKVVLPTVSPTEAAILEREASTSMTAETTLALRARAAAVRDTLYECVWRLRYATSESRQSTDIRMTWVHATSLIQHLRIRKWVDWSWEESLVSCLQQATIFLEGVDMGALRKAAIRKTKAMIVSRARPRTG
jgi:hypothetical protein